MNASEPSFLIYNASAGSGKTYTLTREYLSVLLSRQQGKPFRRILAITFTNKAVGELKSRILDSLELFASTPQSGDPPSMFEAIRDKLGITGEELRARSGHMLQEILHNYAFFDVSTIDKFNHRILRTFARDLQLPAGFEVVTDTDSLLMRAVDTLVQKAGSDPRLTGVLLDFALEKADEDRHWDVAMDLMDMGKMLFNENDLPYLETFRGKRIEDFLELRELLERKAKICEADILRTAADLLELISQHGLEASDFNRASFPKFLDRLLEGQLEQSFTAAWQADFGEKPLWVKRTPEAKRATMDELMPRFAEGFASIRETIFRRSFLLNARKNSAPFTLLGLLRLELGQLQEEEGLLPVAHFNTIIAGELAEQPAAYIYERLGEQYRYYFIDEFQDTSLLQWQNLIPLVSNALSGLGEEGLPGALILVGDAKQAIYRWRGGRAEQFMGLSDQVLNPFPLPARIETLPSNFRSRQTLVDFNNALFAYLGGFLGRESHARLFTEGSRQESKSREPGLVRLEFLPQDTADTSAAYAEKTLEALRELEGKGFPWRDICVLTRRRKEGVVISECLAAAGIPVVSSETLLLKNHPAVRFLISLLRHLRDPADLNPVFEILYFLCPEDRDPHTWIDEHLHRAEKLLMTRYAFDSAAAAFKPVYEILENAIRCFNLGGDAAAYLIFLLDLALEVGLKGDQAIGSFLQHWEAKEDEISLKAPENQNAVRLMTIHQSKGLEFPVVLYPFADSPISGYRQGKLWTPVPPEAYAGFSHLQISKRQEAIHYDPDTAARYLQEVENSELDAMNILYVVHTRAVKALFVISQLPNSRSGPPKTYAELYRAYLDSKGHWSEGVSRYEFGEWPDVDSRADLHDTIPLPFRSKAGSSPAPRMVTRPGRDWASGAEQAIAIGTLVHYALSLIRVRTDLPAALSRLLREGELREPELAELEGRLRRIMDHPGLRSYFEPGWEVYTERDLLIGKAVILRPDRLQIKNGSAVILDYKTGKPRPGHREQLGAYVREVSRMGFGLQRAILVYIDEAEITLEEL